MRIDRRSKTIRGSANPMASAYLDAVAAGFGHMANCAHTNPESARSWLREEGIRYFSSRDVFAFRTRADATRFSERFGRLPKRP